MSYRTNLTQTHTGRTAIRMSLCILVGAILTAIFDLAGPPFPFRFALGPACLMLLVGIFVIPYSMRRKP